MNVFVLKGVISPYDGSYELGAFTTLDKAIEARKEFVTTNGPGAFETYEVYELPLDQLIPNSVLLKPVYEYVPGKTKRRY